MALDRNANEIPHGRTAGHLSGSDRAARCPTVETRREAMLVGQGRLRCQLAVARVVDAQAIFLRRRHQPRRPVLAAIRPGSPAPAMGPGTLGPTLSRYLKQKRADRG